VAALDHTFAGELERRRPRLPRLLPRLVLALALTLAAVALLPTRASAAYVNACRNDPGPIAGTITNDAAIEVHDLHRSEAQNCLAITERLARLADATLELADDDGTTQVTGRVALSALDRQRLDLQWWGIWFAAGSAIGITVGRRLFSELNGGAA
jgi:hypothetical protein